MGRKASCLDQDQEPGLRGGEAGSGGGRADDRR